jgi:hypothetical protein
MSAPSEPFNSDVRRSLRVALARNAYRDDVIRIADHHLDGYTWLVASQRNAYAVSQDGAKIVLHGRFFGICRHDNQVYLFENCGLHASDAPMGRIISMTLANGRLNDPQVVIKGLHVNCHQVRVFDGLLHVVDTANQQILRFQLDGKAVDAKQPFPLAPRTDTTGAYLHINTISRIGDRIGLLLHNGKAEPEKRSEVAWFDRDWNFIERYFIEGRHCHDIVTDEHGILWHCASATGELISSDGRRLKISDSLMTRGISVAGQKIVVGLSSFGPRQNRALLGGSVAILDGNKSTERHIELGSPPTDIVKI